ncbi:MAG: VOC family protein [Clostridiales bacterium]|jgi:catechol 2,3-dioxygenase-like lactoylglutathione lyase family enzyme|nr:VOC family protein [Clostridiales bacterium]
MNPIIDHIDITVGDLKEAVRFYDLLMPLLGFDLAKKRETYEADDDYRQIEYPHGNFIFSIVQAAPGARGQAVNFEAPGALHHLAFRAENNEAVDGFYRKLLGTGASGVVPPAFYKQYAPDYYAVFFCDPFGIRYEVVYYGVWNR